MEKSQRKRIAKEVGGRVAKARARAGMSQQQLANRLGVGLEAVSRMERGVAEATVSRLAELSAILGCPVHDLTLPCDATAAGQALAAQGMLSGLGPEDRSFVLGLMEQLAAHVGKPRS